MNKIILFLFCLFIFLLSVFIRKGGVGLIQKPPVLNLEESDFPTGTELKNFYLFAKKLEHYWSTGKYPFLKNLNAIKCREFFWGRNSVVGEDFLKCNSNLFQCAMENQSQFEIKNGDKLVEFKIQRKFQAIKEYSLQKRFFKTNLQENGIEVSVEEVSSKKALMVFLPNNCHNVFLPQKKYRFSQSDLVDEDLQKSFIDKSFEWQNQEEIFIDQYLVGQREVYEWQNINSMVLESPDVFNWHKPAISLNLKQMRKFCTDRGKKLLTKKIFDAATFYPTPENHSSLFPWGDRAAASHLEPSLDFLFDKAISKSKITKKSCKVAFTSECLGRFKRHYYNQSSVSWTGIFESIGGNLEAFDDHEFNIKASSFYFKAYSPWHILSHRFSWDGLGNDVKNFDLTSSLFGIQGSLKTNKKIGVAFRCYQSSK